MTKKLTFRDHASAACYKLYNASEGFTRLVSYNTIVAEIDKNSWLTVNGLYSATTRKHIGWFMKEQGLSYQLAKQLVTDRQRYNILTGEFQAL